MIRDARNYFDECDYEAKGTHSFISVIIIIFARSRSSARSFSHVFNDAAPLKHPWRAAFYRQKLVGRYVKLVKCDASRLSTLLSLFRSGSLTIDVPIIVGARPSIAGIQL